MKQGIIEYHQTRREIRKANRIARVDTRRNQRLLISIALILFAVLFIIIELLGIMQAKRAHDQELARNLANEAMIELSLVNAGLTSSNQTMLKDAHQQYRKTLEQFNQNDYMKNQQRDLLEQLNNYDQILSNEEKTAELTKLQIAIMMLEKEIEDTDLKKISTKSMIATKESFEDFRNSLEGLDNKRFIPLISELTNYSNEIVAVLDKTAVCVGTCTEKVFKDRNVELEKIFEKYQNALTSFDAEISEYYSPAKLVESLKMLQ